MDFDLEVQGENIPTDAKSVSSSSSSEGGSTQESSKRKTSDRKPTKKKSSTSVDAPNINYHGVTIYQAACQGSLPLCVLLWGMAAARRVRLMIPDPTGNNPMHYAALADTAEVRY